MILVISDDEKADRIDDMLGVSQVLLLASGVNG